MEYRGKQYSVVQGLKGSWRWSTQLDDRTKSGKSPTGKPASSLLKRNKE